MEADEKKSQDEPDISVQENTQTISTDSDNGKPDWIEPDLDFIRALSKRSGNPFKKCMQCGTCSATCELSPDQKPFPGKEMAWAAWGMKDRLLRDPDVWLCYHCNDCSMRCPRGARPGDVLAAVRQESVINLAFPRFIGRWAGEPQSILIMFGIPIILLALALALKVPIENALGIIQPAGERITYAYSSLFPHWLLISFFLFFSFLVLFVVIVGVTRFWKAMKASFAYDETSKPAKALFPSIISTLKNIFTHNDFAKCTKASPRFWSHIFVFFGFLALCMVTLWIITSRINPLIQRDFIYPFNFWNPWKVLANLGGVSLIIGLLLMIKDRFFNNEQTSHGNYFDWVFIGTLLMVVITGFITEILHYVRLDPHRHLIYFIHLVFVLALLLYLPYSKFAHMVYRTTAMVFAEYTGRNDNLKPGAKMEKDRSGQSGEVAAKQDSSSSQHRP